MAKPDARERLHLTQVDAHMLGETTGPGESLRTNDWICLDCTEPPVQVYVHDPGDGSVAYSARLFDSLGAAHDAEPSVAHYGIMFPDNTEEDARRHRIIENRVPPALALDIAAVAIHVYRTDNKR